MTEVEGEGGTLVYHILLLGYRRSGHEGKFDFVSDIVSIFQMYFMSRSSRSHEEFRYK